MQVSDRIVVLLLASFLVLAPLAGWPLESIVFGMAAALIAFFASVALFTLGWMGGGDGKLITVSVLWVGADQATDFVVHTALLGGLCALFLLVFRRLSLPSNWQDKAWIVRLHAPETGVPYAVAIGIAGLISLPQTPWLAVIA